MFMLYIFCHIKKSKHARKKIICIRIWLVLDWLTRKMFDKI